MRQDQERRTCHDGPVERNNRRGRLDRRSSRIALDILALLVRRLKRDIGSAIQITRDISTRQTRLVRRVDNNRTAQQRVRLGEEPNVRIAVSKGGDLAVRRSVQLSVFASVCVEIKSKTKWDGRRTYERSPVWQYWGNAGSHTRPSVTSMGSRWASACTPARGQRIRMGAIESSVTRLGAVSVSGDGVGVDVVRIGTAEARVGAETFENVDLDKGGRAIFEADKLKVGVYA